MVSSLHFDNYKCLSGSTFCLNKLNLFTGYNGRGKSSVVQMLLMLSQSLRKDDVNSMDRLHLNGDFVQLGDFVELLAAANRYDLGVTIGMTDGSILHEVELNYSLGNDDKVGELSSCMIDGIDYFDVTGMANGVDGETKSQNRSLRHLPQYIYQQFWSQNVHYVSANRQGPVRFVERREVPEVHTVGADGALTINTLSTYADEIDVRMNVKHGDSSSYRLPESTRQWLDYIMTGGAVVVDDSEKIHGSASRKSPILKLEFSFNGSEHFQSYNVGFGYSYVLPIIVTALIAREGNMVVVENPEAHLHPEAQVRLTYLLTKLAARGVQVFVESHSEHVINAIRLAVLKDEYSITNKDISIFFFDDDYSKRDLFVEKNGRINNWPEHFFDQYQRELAEIMTLGAQVK